MVLMIPAGQETAGPELDLPVEIRRIQAIEDFEPEVRTIAETFDGPQTRGWTR